MSTNYTQALLKLVPGARFTIKGNDYDKVEWHPANPPMPTDLECEAVDTSAEEAALATARIIKTARADRMEEALYGLARFVKSKHPDMPQELKDILKEVGEE